MFLNRNDVDIIHECGYLKSDNTLLCSEFEFILIEQHEEDLSYIKKEDESILENFLMKTEQSFSNIV